VNVSPIIQISGRIDCERQPCYSDKLHNSLQMHVLLFRWTAGFTANASPIIEINCRINYERHSYKFYCSTVHFRRITSIYQPTNAHIVLHKTLLNRFKTLRHVSILSDHHQGALFLGKVILQYSQFNSYSYYSDKLQGWLRTPSLLFR